MTALIVFSNLSVTSYRYRFFKISELTVEVLPQFVHLPDDVCFPWAFFFFDPFARSVECFVLTFDWAPQALRSSTPINSFSASRFIIYEKIFMLQVIFKF